MSNATPSNRIVIAGGSGFLGVSLAPELPFEFQFSNLADALRDLLSKT